MPDRTTLTRCPRWFELNLSALRTRELCRALGLGGGLTAALFLAIPKLFRRPIRTGMLFPEEVTVIWDVPLQGLEPPRDLVELEFQPLGAFELPEFTGHNVTCLYCDREQTTYCELVYAQSGSDQMSGISLSSELEGAPRERIKSVQTWKVNPLDQPEGFHNRRFAPPLKSLYGQHRNWLASMARRPATTSMDAYLQQSGQDQRTLSAYYARRRVMVEARPELVEQLLREKGLSRGPA